jgi:hypothetical protein
MALDKALARGMTDANDGCVTPMEQAFKRLRKAPGPPGNFNDRIAPQKISLSESSKFHTLTPRGHTSRKTIYEALA